MHAVVAARDLEARTSGVIWRAPRRQPASRPARQQQQHSRTTRRSAAARQSGRMSGESIASGYRCGKAFSVWSAGVEKAVGRRRPGRPGRRIVGQRQQMTRRRRRSTGQASAWRCKNASICCLALGLEHRAGAVQQPAARLQQRPQRIEQPAWVGASASMSVARRSQRMSGWRRTMPEALHGASSRIASKGGRPTSRRARRRRPPACCACRPSRASVSSTRAQPLRVAVDREQLERPAASRAGARSCRPARRRRRGPRAGRQRGQPGGRRAAAARPAGPPASCTETSPSSKPGSRCTGTGRSSTIAASRPQAPAASPSRMPGSASAAPAARIGQPRQIVVDAAVRAVDAQRHRRAPVVGGQDAPPLLRPVGAQPFDPPRADGCGARPDRSASAASSAVALAQEAAQHRIDEAGAAGAPLRGRLHRLVDQRVRRVDGCAGASIAVGRGAARRPAAAAATPAPSAAGIDRRRRGLRRQPARSAVAVPSRRSTSKLSAWVPGRAAAGQRASASLSDLAGAHGLHRVGGMAEQAGQRKRGIHRAESTGSAGRRAAARPSRLRCGHPTTAGGPCPHPSASHDLSQRGRAGPAQRLAAHPLPAAGRRLPLPRQRQHRRLHRRRRDRRAARRGAGQDAGGARGAGDRHRQRPQHQRHRPPRGQDVPDRGLPRPLRADAGGHRVSRTSRASTS